MSETETPFRPREKLIEKQKYFQSLHRHTYLKGPYDKITSVAIPLALAGASLFMICCGCNVFHKLVDNLNLFHEMKCYVSPGFNYKEPRWDDVVGLKYLKMVEDETDDDPSANDPFLI